MENFLVEFEANIVSINNIRFQITIPKKLIDAKVIDPEKKYIIKIQEAKKAEVDG